MNRTIAFAILVSLAMIGGSFLVVGESQALTPQTGSVNVQISYGSLSTIASSNTTFTIKNYEGVSVASGTGNTLTTPVSLNYGKYYVEVNPLYTSTSTHGQIIANRTIQAFSLDSSSLTVPVNVNVLTTVSENVNVSGITSSNTAHVSLVTTGGFNFENFTMNSTKHVVNAYVPTSAFYVSVSYSGSTYLNQETGSAASTIVVNLPTSKYISGFVTTSSGATVSQVNAVVFNATSQTYTTSHFGSSSFALQSNTFADKYVFISAPGYNTTQLINPATSKLYHVVLNQASSSVYYNYSLSKDLQHLYFNVTYDVGNNTTLPGNYFGNSSVGSLYWQIKLDGLSSGNAVTSYIANLASNYTDNSITVNGYIYNLTSAPTATATVGTNTVTGSMQAQYSNTGVPSSLGTSGYTVKIHALGTQTTPGSFNHYYNFTYANSGLSLASSSAQTSTFKSPIQINPVSTTQWVTLTLSTVQNPAVIDSEIALYWNGLTSTNYLLNGSYSNTAFIAPHGQSTSLNASNAYFNPVTGKNDYQNANFTWTIGSSTQYGYNTSYTFTGASTAVTLKVVSPSGGNNTTSFKVITTTASPNVNYSVSLTGKMIQMGSATPAADTGLTVPQSSLVTYSAEYSSLNVSGYSVPLEYNWYLPNYTSAAQIITYAFAKPFVSVGYQYANLNVSTVFGSSTNVTFKVNVNDTTPPVPNMKLTNATGSTVSQPTAGATTVFSANGSTDPYYSSGLTYQWKISYSNGTTVQNGSTTYSIVGGSFNSSYVALKFNTLTSLVVSLKATNPSNVSAYSNKTVNIIVNSPRLVVNGIYMSGNLTQGSQSTIYVNVSNNGTVTANDFTISIFVSGKQVASQTYNRILSVGQYANLSLNYTPGTSGKTQLTFQANNNSEPSFMAPLGNYVTTVTIKAPAYKTPLIIGSIVLVIVVVGIVYYRLSSGKTTKKPKQQPKPKTDLKRPQDKKK